MSDVEGEVSRVESVVSEVEDVASEDELLRRALACADRACSGSFAEEVMTCVTATVKESLKARSVALVLLEPETDGLVIAEAQGLSPQFMRSYRRSVGTGVVGEVLWNDRKVLLDKPDTNSSEYIDLKMELDFQSLVCVRVAGGGRPLGFLLADSDSTGHFTSRDLVLLRLLADLVALAVERDRTLTSARQTTLDKTTPRVYPYGYFHRRLTEEIERAQRLNERLSLLLVVADVPNGQTPANALDPEFFGELVSVLKQATRSIDVMGRYGAEQVVLYLPETSQDAALKAAQRIRQTVEHTGRNAENAHATVSIGVATLPENGETVEQLMNALTSAFFKAQRTGGNRVSGPAEMYVI